MKPLARPAASGFMGYYTIDGAFDLRAGAVAGGPAPLAYSITGNGVEWRSPVLVAETGTRVRATLTNALDEPTIVHWHGLTIDSANDGNGDTLAMPGGRFDYAFALRNRAGVYWYHPHPHGLTAGQIQCGLFGVLLVDDAEDRALGNALTFRLAFRGDDGKLLAFTLLGTDGGLLAQPLACRELFLASAERIDVWVDFAGRATGDSVVLESLAFDPMHGEAHGGSHAPVPDAADPHAGHGDAPHVGPSDAPHAAGGDGPHAAQGVATTSAIGDGARLSLLQFRIRQRVADGRR